MLHGTQPQDKDMGLHPAATSRQVGSKMPTGRTWDPLSSHQGSSSILGVENSSRSWIQQDITKATQRGQILPRDVTSTAG